MPQPLVKVATFDNLNPAMQLAVREAVTNACDIVNDLSVDDESVATLAFIRSNAYIAMQVILDPDACAIVLPEPLKQAINDYVNAKVAFKVMF